MNDEVYPATGSCTPLGASVVVDSTLIATELFLTVLMPFTTNELGGADALSVDLARRNSSADDWELAVAGNAQPSPGHEPLVLGDRFVVTGSAIPALSDELGEYGVYWDPSTGEGFAWANADGASEFAPVLQANGDPGVIPAVSQWGIVVIALLLLAGAKIHFGRRRGAKTAL